MFLRLPACFSYAGDLALVGKFSEADTANTVFSQISMRTTADFAAIILSAQQQMFPAKGGYKTFVLFQSHLSGCLLYTSPEKNSEEDIDLFLSLVSAAAAQKEFFNNPVAVSYTHLVISFACVES